MKQQPSRKRAALSPELRERLSAIKHVLLDMDATVYCGDRLYPTSKPFFKLLASLNIGYSFLTNNSSKSVEDYECKLARMGLAVPKGSVYTSTLFAAEYIHERHPRWKRLFVLGTESMKLELQSLGFSVATRDPDAVLVGYDSELSYKKLGQAAYWLSTGLPFIATHPDRFCPSDAPDFLAIDCGCISEMLRKASGNKPTVLGKPSPEMLRHALLRYGLSAKDAAMCGDRYGTDVKMALDAKAFSVHICDGSCEGRRPPALCVPHLMAFGELLAQARS